MKRLIASIALLALLIASGASAQQQVSFTGASASVRQPGNAYGSSNIAKGTASFTTNALNVLGCTQVAYTLYAATGADSAVLVQVSQDSTKWSAGSPLSSTSPEEAIATAASTQAYLDSLNTSPTAVITSGGAGTGPSTFPIAYQYMRLKIYPFSLIPQTSSAITIRRFYPDGTIITNGP